jgi:hypothetical protein
MAAYDHTDVLQEQVLSAANITARRGRVDPLIAMGWQPHHSPVVELFCDDPLGPEDPTPVEAMAHRLKTREDRRRAQRHRVPGRFRNSRPSGPGTAMRKARMRHPLRATCDRRTSIYLLKQSLLRQGRGLWLHFIGRRP